MATAVKLYEWNSDLESFTPNAASTDSTLSRDTGQGSPTNGSLKAVTVDRNSNDDNYWRLSGIDWTDLNVPAGSTVTHVQITEIRTYAGLSNWATVDSVTFSVEIYESTGVIQVTGATLFSRNTTSQDGSWQTGNGSNQAVNSSYQAETTALIIDIHEHNDLGNDKSAAASAHVDYLEITVTYTPSAFNVNKQDPINISESITTSGKLGDISVSE